MAHEVKFIAEDLVKLNVPSPLMTVIGYNKAGEVICNWFSTTGDFQVAAFPESVLELIELPNQHRPMLESALSA